MKIEVAIVFPHMLREYLVLHLDQCALLGPCLAWT